MSEHRHLAEVVKGGRDSLRNGRPRLRPAFSPYGRRKMSEKVFLLKNGLTHKSR